MTFHQSEHLAIQGFFIILVLFTNALKLWLDPRHVLHTLHAFVSKRISDQADKDCQKYDRYTIIEGEAVKPFE